MYEFIMYRQEGILLAKKAKQRIKEKLADEQKDGRKEDIFVGVAFQKDLIGKTQQDPARPSKL